MSWQAIELIEDYWIIQDPKTMEEFVDSVGENLVFESEAEALYFIEKLEYKP